MCGRDLIDFVLLHGLYVWGGEDNDWHLLVFGRSVWLESQHMRTPPLQGLYDIVPYLGLEQEQMLIADLLVWTF